MPAEKVLFVCIGNAGRSQMAQAFAERAGLEVRSAGSHAESHLHPEVIGWRDLVEAGSRAEAARRGQQRLEGKDYVVADRDILNIRFNV